jgi:hypothetical protein
MLHGRRLTAILFPTIAVLPLAALDLFGQDKGDKAAKDKSSETAAKKDESSKDSSKKLEWKFEKNKIFYQKMVTTTKQTMKVMNNDVAQSQSQTFYFQWTPQEKTADGKWKLEQKIIGVQMDIDIGGSPIKYDSLTGGGGGANSPLNDFFKALLGASFTVTLDPKTNKLGDDIGGRDAFVANLQKANKQMQPLLDKILSKEAIKEMAEPTFAVLPPDAVVEKDKKWKKETTLDMGPIGKYKNEYTYTYAGRDKNLDKIDVDSKLTYIPPEKTEGIGGLPFRIKSAKLESKSAKGAVYFNREKGRVEKSNMSVNLDGTLEIEIGGQLTKVDLTQTQTTEVSATDTNPIETKATAK